MRNIHHFYKELACGAFVLFAALFLAILLLTGCAPTRKQCEQNYGPCGVPAEQIKVTERDTLVITERDSVKVYIQCKNDTLYINGKKADGNEKHTSGKGKANLNTNAPTGGGGGLWATGDCPSDTVKITLRDTVRVETKVQQPDMGKDTGFRLNNLLIGLVIGAGLMLAVWGIPKIIRLVRPI